MNIYRITFYPDNERAAQSTIHPSVVVRARSRAAALTIVCRPGLEPSRVDFIRTGADEDRITASELACWAREERKSGMMFSFRRADLASAETGIDRQTARCAYARGWHAGN